TGGHVRASNRGLSPPNTLQNTLSESPHVQYFILWNEFHQVTMQKFGSHRTRESAVMIVRSLVASVFIVAMLVTSPVHAAARLTFVMPNSPTPYRLGFMIAKDLGWYSKAG